jgi:hypothetical protein
MRKGRVVVTNAPLDCAVRNESATRAVSMTFAPDAYMKRVVMVNTSAAALQAWMQASDGELKN